MSQELRLRIISSIVLAAVVLLATWSGGMAFRLLAALIGLLIFYEWSTITKIAHEDRAGNMAGWASQAAIAGNIVFGTLGTSLALMLAFFIVLSLRTMLRRTGSWLPVGVLYAGASGVTLAALRGDTSNGLIAVFFVFAVVWGTDIMAYFAGRAIGGPKLAPSISPGKTWSGALGGTVSGVIAGVLLLAAVGQAISVGLILLALILSVASQCGDLFESFIKRRFGVKDSSRLIPGHGGVMDRVDGLVFASFAAFLTSLLVILGGGGMMANLANVLLGL